MLCKSCERIIQGCALSRNLVVCDVLRDERISRASSQAQIVYMRNGLPPNGLAFSCRERARRCLQNANDLAREAVNCNAVLGGAMVEYPIPIGKKSCGMPRNVIRMWSLRCDRSFGTRFGLPNATAK